MRGERRKRHFDGAKKLADSDRAGPPVGSKPFPRIRSSARSSFLNNSLSSSPTSVTGRRVSRTAAHIPVGADPRSEGRQPRLGRNGVHHKADGPPTPGPTPGPTPRPISGSTPAAIIRVPSRSTLPVLRETSSPSAHPESNATEDSGPQAESAYPSAAKPIRTKMEDGLSVPKMSLLYASSGMFEALTSETNQKNEHSLNKFLGWPSVQHTRASVLHTRDINGDVIHDDPNNDGYHEDNHIPTGDHAGDHHDRRYDRKTLLNIVERMDLSRYRSLDDNDRYVLDPLVSLRLIDRRELDLPCYNGRYHQPMNYDDHSTRSYGSLSFDHLQQRLQQERRLKILESQGCYEHPSDSDDTN